MKVIHPRSLVTFFCFVLSCSLSQAQTFAIQRYGVAEGLPSAEVYHIFQDSKGFIWFSTDNGVVKYDGFYFKSFNVADGLPDPVVFETKEDFSGKIWFRTYSGKIAYVENEKVYPYKFNEQLAKACSESYLISMVPDKEGRMWYSTGYKSWGYIGKDGEIVKHEVSNGRLFFKTIEQDYITAFSRATWGIDQLILNDSTYKIQLSDAVDHPKKSHSTVRSLVWRGNQYININNNIFRYDGASVTRVYRGHAAIISLTVDHRNNLWVGFLNGGAILFNNTNFENGEPLAAIGQNSATMVMEDNEHGLWVSTLENGVFYIPNPDIQHFSINSDSKVDAAIVAGDQIITGEYDGTLSKIDTKSKKIISKQKFDRSILTILKAKNKTWVASETLYVLDELKKTKFRNPLSVTIRDLAEDHQGNIWGIEATGISKYDENGNQIFKKGPPTPYRNIVAFDSVMLVGLHTGLNIYDLEANLIKSPKQLASFKISDIVRLGDSFLVGTIGNGFLITKDFDQFTHYESPARNIYDVVQSGSDVWLATEKGILKSTVHSILTNQPSYDFLTKRNGLLNMQVSHLLLAGKELFAFYNNSFSVIPTAKKKYINQSPIFYLKSIKVNNQINNNNSTQLDLPYDQNNIQLDFGFISFNHQDILTRYRLSKNQTWNYLTERTIDLFSLSPGDYPLEFEYSIDNIHWTKAQQIPAIRISQAWWQRIEFQVTFIVGIIGLIYLFFNNRLVIYRQRTEKMRLLSVQQEQLTQTEIETLERERNRIAKDLHDSVGTNILATKLNVNRLLKKHQEPESDAIEEQFQETMLEIKDIIYNLAPPGLERYGLATALKNYVDRIASSTVVSFNVNTFGKDLLNTKLSVPLFRILQELITNSLKHSKTKSITIHLNSFEDLYNVVYEDKGIGFSMEGNSKGLGLQSIESRVKSIHGKMSFESGPFGISYSFDVPIKK